MTSVIILQETGWPSLDSWIITIGALFYGISCVGIIIFGAIRLHNSRLEIRDWSEVIDNDGRSRSSFPFRSPRELHLFLKFSRIYTWPFRSIIRLTVRLLTTVLVVIWWGIGGWPRVCRIAATLTHFKKRSSSHDWYLIHYLEYVDDKESLRESEVEHLCELLHSEDKEIQQKAINLLSESAENYRGVIGEYRSTIMEFLSGESLGIRRDAEEILQKIIAAYDVEGDVASFLEEITEVHGSLCPGIAVISEVAKRFPKLVQRDLDEIVSCLSCDDMFFRYYTAATLAKIADWNPESFDVEGQLEFIIGNASKPESPRFMGENKRWDENTANKMQGNTISRLDDFFSSVASRYPRGIEALFENYDDEASNFDDTNAKLTRFRENSVLALDALGMFGDDDASIRPNVSDRGEFTRKLVDFAREFPWFVGNYLALIAPYLEASEYSIRRNTAAIFSIVSEVRPNAIKFATSKLLELALSDHRLVAEYAATAVGNGASEAEGDLVDSIFIEIEEDGECGRQAAMVLSHISDTHPGVLQSHLPELLQILNVDDPWVQSFCADTVSNVTLSLMNYSG